MYMEGNIIFGRLPSKDVYSHFKVSFKKFDFYIYLNLEALRKEVISRVLSGLEFSCFWHGFRKILYKETMDVYFYYLHKYD